MHSVAIAQNVPAAAIRTLPRGARKACFKKKSSDQGEVGSSLPAAAFLS